MKIALLAALALATVATSVETREPVRVTLGAALMAPGDTIRVVARWGPSIATDVDYVTRWETAPARNGFPVIKAPRRYLSDTVFFAAPPNMTDSVRVDFAVWTTRFGRVSRDSSKVFKWFKRADIAPPGPGPVILDTALVTVDSVAVFLSNSNLVLTAGQDTGMACAYARAHGKWYATVPPVQVKATQTSLTTARVDLNARSTPFGYCDPALRGRLTVQAGWVLPVTWSPVPEVNMGGGGFEAAVDGKRSGGKTPVRNSRAHE